MGNTGTKKSRSGYRYLRYRYTSARTPLDPIAIRRFGAIGMLTGSYITGKGPLEVMDAGNTIVF